jgi:hypothetical protein
LLQIAPNPDPPGKRGRSYCSEPVYFNQGPLAMIENRKDSVLKPELSARAPRAGVWHRWTVIMPRRSITGRLLFGPVWRRHDGRRWIYKRFFAANENSARSS